MRQKPYLAVLATLLLLAAFGGAQTKKPAAKATASAPNKALLQKIWDGWSTLDVSKVSEFYPRARTPSSTSRP